MQDREGLAELKSRMASFAIRVIKAAESLPPSRTADVPGKQMLRSGTGAAANYRASCRARSTAEFLAKLGIVEEELDETLFWIDLIVQAGLMSEQKLSLLPDEGEQLLKITVTSIKTARKRSSKAPSRRNKA